MTNASRKTTAGNPALLLIALTVSTLAGCGHEPSNAQSNTADVSVADSKDSKKEAPGDESLAAACQYLWSEQHEDGAWRSEIYAILKGGQTLTPFILDALLRVPESVVQRPEGGVERALTFMRNRAGESGVPDFGADTVLEYPTYEMAYTLRCFVQAGSEEDQPLIDALCDRLASSQYHEGNGFKPESLAYGGWGFGGPRPENNPGHMDLAHTRRAVEALRLARHEDEQLYDRCRQFLAIVQRHPSAKRPQPDPKVDKEHSTNAATPYDGGFYFSPIVLDANKGRLAEEDSVWFYRSYATATCDGLLALLAAGVSEDDERVVKAFAWLRDHEQFDYPQGVPQDYPEPWGPAIRFYHFAVRAEVYHRLNVEGDWHERLAAEVINRQRDDGSFVNTQSALMKEDDPLLCTALAVVALAHAGE